jgi:hypothetical protein
MTTINPRINITIPKDIADVLNKKAISKEVPLSEIVLDLIMDAIERDEDIYYSKIAEKREKENKKWISHDKAWK